MSGSRTHKESSHGRPRAFAAGRAAVSGTLLLSWTLVGCYSFVPVIRNDAVPLQENVRVTITAAGTESLAKVLGANIREIQGTVVRVTPDTVTVAVEQTWTSARETFVSTGDTVAIARQLTEKIAVRQVSRKKSFVVTAAIIGAAILVAVVTKNASGGSTAGPTPMPIQP